MFILSTAQLFLLLLLGPSVITHPMQNTNNTGSGGVKRPLDSAPGPPAKKFRNAEYQKALERNKGLESAWPGTQSEFEYKDLANWGWQPRPGEEAKDVDFDALTIPYTRLGISTKADDNVEESWTHAGWAEEPKTSTFVAGHGEV